VAGCLKHNASHVDIGKRLRSDIVVGDALPVFFSTFVLCAELLALECETPSTLVDVFLDVLTFILKSDPCVLAFLTDLAIGTCHFHLSPSAVIPNRIIFRLLLRDELLPHSGLLFFERLALLMEKPVLFPDLLLRLLHPQHVGFPDVSDHRVKLVL
jgi:hypothetical protein